MNLNKKIISLIKKKDEACDCRSCTGGMLSSAITSVSGSSIFTLISVSNQAKNISSSSKNNKKMWAMTIMLFSYLSLN